MVIQVAYEVRHGYGENKLSLSLESLFLPVYHAIETLAASVSESKPVDSFVRVPK